MSFLIIGVVAFLAFTIWGRVVGEKGMRQLTDEQRSSMLLNLAGTRKWSVIFLAGIILGFLLLAYYVELDKIVAMYCYFGAFILYTLVVGWMGISGLKKLEFPEEYIKTAWLANILRLVGLIVLTICMGQFITQNAGSLQNGF